MKEQEYQSKFFLTGFLLASALIIYITMVFVMLLLAMIISSVNSIMFSFIVEILICLAYFYSLHRFERKQSYSKMVLWYVLTICLLGLLISSICYLSVVVMAVLSMYAIPVVAIPLTAILGYIVVTEIYSVVALLASSFELREIEQRKFPTIYLLTVVTLFVISYVFKDIAYYSVTTTVTTIIGILLSTFYMLYGIKYGPVQMEIESVEDRYKFVIKALIHASLAPIHIPVCIKNRIIEMKLKN